MRRSIARGSVLAVAALSVLLGGTSNTTNVKEQVSQTPVIVGKVIEQHAVAGNLVKEIAGKTVAQADSLQVAQAVSEETAETEEAVVEPNAQDHAALEVKAAKVESNQVVANIDSYLNIREEASEDAEVVGKFYTGNVGTVMERGEEWSLVSSGNAYGYVKNDYLLFGEAAEEYIEYNCDQVAKVTTDTLNIRAEESTDSEVVTLSDEGDRLTVLGEENGWVKVAVTDDAIGYVSSDFVCVDYIYETAVTIEEEQAAEAERIAEEQAAEAERIAEERAAEEASEATENPAVTTEAPATEVPATTEAPATEAPKQEETYTEESTQSSSGVTGQDVADYAVQFVGNPYVYGGTSLTNGADCSGFVQSVYKHFGYSLSRTSQSQAGDGTAVSLDSLQPGDLLFYHGYGHVAIYIGGGQVVHASTAATGIKISNYDYSPIDKAVRIIQ